ncbi:MAG: putative peptidoglycan lipid II flippase [Candidatus Paceibacteria bacterium]|jgi:putative peptidoglycan lipid II flippase
MVSQVFKLLNKEIRGLHEAAYLLALFAFTSQILALVRDRVFAGRFGASEILDVYYAAFRVPDLIFVAVSSLVSVSVLVPFLTKYLDKGKEETKEFMNSIFTVVIFLSILLSTLALLFAEQILNIFVPELLSGEYGRDLVILTQIMLLQPFFLSLSNLFGSLAQVYKKFFVYALSPVLYNLGILVGLLFFYPIYGIAGLAIGVVLGALLHLLIQIPTALKTGLIPRFTGRVKAKYITEVLTLSVPRTFALTANQLVLIFLISLAGTMIQGSISIFTLSFNLQAVPLSIIGVSYSIAAFPSLSRFFADGNMSSFLEHIVRATKHIIFWSLPVAVLFIVLRAQIVRTVLGAGEFSWTDTRLTAAALALFAVSILAQSLILLFVRGYYSAGETKKPLFFATISTLVTIISAYGLVFVFNHLESFRLIIERLLKVDGIDGTVILMLPLAYSIGQILYAFLLWVSFDNKYKCFSESVWRPAIHSLGASLIMGYVAFLMLQVLDDVFDLDTFMGIFLQGFISGVAGIAVGILVLVVLKNEEIKTVWGTLHKKIWKTKLIVAERDEV